MLKQRSKFLNICHANACSLYRKTSFFSELLCNSNISVFCVTETWLNDSHSDAMLCIPGYRILRSDRDRGNKRGGGVCIYLANHLKFKLLSKSAAGSKLEFLCIELHTSHGSAVMVCVVYNPPRNNDLTALTHIFESYSHRYSDIIITGDFNINTNPRNICANRANFLNAVNDHGLHVVNNFNTHFSPVPTTTPSCLDLFIVGNAANAVMFDQLDISVSHHDMIVMSYNLPHTPPSANKTFSRSFKNIDIAYLHADCNQLGWADIFYLPDPDAQLRVITDLLLQLLETHAPLREIRQRPVERRSRFLENLTLERDMAHKQWRRSRLSGDWDIFKLLRDRVSKHETEEIQKRHSSLFSPALSSKELWRNINRLGIKNDKSRGPALFSSTALNTHFIGNSGSSRNLSADVPHDRTQQTAHLNSHSDDFSFRNATSDEVFAMWCKIARSRC